MTKEGTNSMTQQNPNYRPAPIDFRILDKLPDRGLIGGIRWRGRRVKDIREEIIAELRAELGSQADEVLGDLTMNFFMARVRSMHVAGLVENYGGTGIGGTSIWARTEDGVAFMDTREEVLGS
jgi:hypothetical protein